MRIAIPTQDTKGLRGEVDEVFSRAPFFTLVDLEDGKVANTTVIENAASTFSHGAGPIAVKVLIDKGVELLLAPLIGIGTSKLLEETKIRYIKVEKHAKISRLLSELNNFQ